MFNNQKERKLASKRVWIVLAPILFLISGILVIKSVRYYQGADLQKQVDAMRLREQKKTGTPVVKRTARTLKAVNLREFYGRIELTEQQRSYAETTVTEFNSQMAEYQNQLNELKKETVQSFLNTIGGIAKAGVKESALTRINIKQWFEKIQQRDDISQLQKIELERKHQDYQDKVKEIQQAQRRTKKIYTSALIALLTPEQQQVYRQEHPPAPAKNTGKPGELPKPKSNPRVLSMSNATP
jgi:hypothetical protein